LCSLRTDVGTGVGRGGRRLNNSQITFFFYLSRDRAKLRLSFRSTRQADPDFFMLRHLSHYISLGFNANVTLHKHVQADLLFRLHICVFSFVSSSFAFNDNPYEVRCQGNKLKNILLRYLSVASCRVVCPLSARTAARNVLHDSKFEWYY
jgi:hypothetical protein